jgi:hypothetical protein
VRHGKGVYTYNNGDIYDGEWENNEKHGTGKLTSNGVTTIGIWRGGLFVNPTEREGKDAVSRQ